MQGSPTSTNTFLVSRHLGQVLVLILVARLPIQTTAFCASMYDEFENLKLVSVSSLGHIFELLYHLVLRRSYFKVRLEGNVGNTLF